ncbi:MAG: cupin domain-containing protein [Planctomycetes bacterium]|nr:cupin domain-containing protein [Planctomycetota bacterium]
MTRILNLNDLPLEEVTAHEGEGKIRFNRVFSEEAFGGPWNFVDYAVLPPGTSIGIHTHGDNEELYLVLEGTGTMHLDGKDHPVRPGSVILNRRGGTHGLKNTGRVPLKIFVTEVRI